MVSPIAFSSSSLVQELHAVSMQRAFCLPAGLEGEWPKWARLPPEEFPEGSIKVFQAFLLLLFLLLIPSPHSYIHPTCHPHLTRPHRTATSDVEGVRPCKSTSRSCQADTIYMATGVLRRNVLGGRGAVGGRVHGDGRLHRRSQLLDHHGATLVVV
jgi:hypothetical protein